MEFIKQECLNKSECKINGLKQFFPSDGQCMKKKTKFGKEITLFNDHYLYLQIGCAKNEHSLREYNVFSLI